MHPENENEEGKEAGSGIVFHQGFAWQLCGWPSQFKGQRTGGEEGTITGRLEPPSLELAARKEGLGGI